MTRKDFELIAAALRDARQRIDTEISVSAVHDSAILGWEFATLDIANSLATTNPAFNLERFLTAARRKS